MINDESDIDEIFPEWKKFLIRDEFMQLYFENLNLTQAFKVERLVDLNDVKRKKANQKFLFGIVRTNCNNHCFQAKDYLETSSKAERLINENQIILMYSNDATQYDSSINFLSLAFTGLANTQSNLIFTDSEDSSVSSSVNSKISKFIAALRKFYATNEDKMDFDEFDYFLKSDEVMRKEHLKMVDSVFGKDLETIHDSEENGQSFSLFFVSDSMLLEFVASNHMLKIADRDGVTEKNVREKISDYLIKQNKLNKTEVEEHMPYYDDFTMFEELTEKPKDELIPNNLGEFLVILLCSILFIVNFMIAVPPNNFYELQDILVKSYEYDLENNPIHVQNYEELKRFFEDIIIGYTYNTTNTFGYKVTNLHTLQFLLMNSSQEPINVTTISFKKNSYYIYDSNIFSGLMLNCKFGNKTNNTNNNTIYDTTAEYLGQVAVPETDALLSFNQDEINPLYPNSYQFFFKPNLGSNGISWFTQQVTPAFTPRLTEMAFTLFFFNSDYDIALVYSLDFTIDTFGSVSFKRFFQGYQPFLNVNNMFIPILILNIFYFIFLLYVGYIVIISFSNRVYELVKNRIYTFEWYDWIDVVVFIVSLASQIMFCNLLLFRSEVFPILCSNEDDFNYWVNLATDIQGYHAITGVAMLLIFVRLIRFLYTTFPAFRIIYQTLSSAARELSSLLLIVGLMLVGLLFLAQSAIGWYSSAFRLFDSSFMSLYLMFIGIFSYDELFDSTVTYAFTTYFFIAFMIFFNLILFNVFLCIIRGNYSATKDKIQLLNEALLLISTDQAKEIGKKIFALVTLRSPKAPAEDFTQTEVENKSPNSKKNVEKSSEKQLAERESSDDISRETFWQIIKYNWRNLNVSSLFSRQILKPEELQSQKLDKIRYIRKKMIKEYVEELQFDYRKEFGGLIDSFCFSFFIIIFILLIHFQMKMTFGSNVDIYMKSEFLNKFNNQLAKIRKFSNAEDEIVKMFRNIYGQGASSDTDGVLNKEMFSNYIFLNPPYFRVTLRQFTFINTEDKWKKEYFPVMIDKINYLDKENCPAPYENNVDYFYKSGDTLMRQEYEEAGTYSSLDQCGGYIIFANETSIFKDNATYLFIDDMFKNNLGTLALDYVIFSKYHDFLVYHRIFFMRGPMGKLKFISESSLIPVNRYTSMSDFNRIYLEIIYYIFVLYYFIKELNKIIGIIKRKLSENYEESGETEKFKDSSLLNKYLRIDFKNFQKLKGITLICKFACNLLWVTITKTIHFTFLVLFSIIEHMSNDFFNFFDLFSILISISMAFLWFQIVSVTYRFSFQELNNNDTYYYDENEISYSNELFDKYNTYIFWQAINALLLFIRIIQFFKFSKSIYSLILVIIRASSIIILHLVFLFVLNIGFALFGYALFSQNSAHYSDLSTAIIYLFIILAGKISAKDIMYLNEPWGKVFFILFTSVNFLAVLNILYSILIESYREIKKRQKQNLSEVSQVNFLKTVQMIFTAQYSDFISRSREYTINLQKLYPLSLIESSKVDKEKIGVKGELIANNVKKTCCTMLYEYAVIKRGYYAKIQELVKRCETENMIYHGIYNPVTIYNKILVYVAEKMSVGNLNILMAESSSIQNSRRNGVTRRSKTDLSLSRHHERRKPEIVKMKKNESLWKKVFFTDVYQLFNFKWNNFFKKNLFQKYYMTKNININKIYDICEEEKHNSTNPTPNSRIYRLSKEVFAQEYSLIKMHEIFFTETINQSSQFYLTPLLPCKQNQKGACILREVDDQNDTPCQVCAIAHKKLQSISSTIYDILIKHFFTPHITAYEDFHLYMGFYLYQFKKTTSNVSKIKAFTKEIPSIKIKEFMRDILRLRYKNNFSMMNIRNFNMNKQEDVNINKFENIELQLHFYFVIWNTLYSIVFGKNSDWVEDIRNHSTSYEMMTKYAKNKAEGKEARSLFSILFNELHCLDEKELEERDYEIYRLPRHISFGEAMRIMMRHESLTGNIEYIDESDKHYQFYSAKEKLMLEKTDDFTAMLPPEEVPKEIVSMENYPSIFPELWKSFKFEEMFSLFFGFNDLLIDYRKSFTDFQSSKEILSPDFLSKYSNRLDISEYFTLRHRAEIFMMLPPSKQFSIAAVTKFKKLLEKKDMSAHLTSLDLKAINTPFEVIKYFNDRKVNYMITSEFCQDLFETTLSKAKDTVMNIQQEYKHAFRMFFRESGMKMNPVGKLALVKFLDLSMSKDKILQIEKYFTTGVFEAEVLESSSIDSWRSDKELKNQRIYEEAKDLELFEPENMINQKQKISISSDSTSAKEEKVKMEPFLWALGLNQIDFLNAIRKIPDTYIREFYLQLYTFFYFRSDEDPSYFFKRKLKLNLIEKYEKYIDFLDLAEQIGVERDNVLKENKNLERGIDYLQKRTNELNALLNNWSRMRREFEYDMKPTEGQQDELNTKI